MPEMSRVSTSLEVQVTREVQKENRNLIVRGLLEYNSLHLGEQADAGLDVYVRDANGQIIGGLIGDVSLGWLSIHALWVAEGHRRSGVGESILKAAEDAAFRAGCRSAVLDTLSFQAPAFYEKRGYDCIAVVDGFRGGVQKIFMQKRLSGHC